VLASTREQEQLLRAGEDRWAHLIIIGDPQQPKPIGAAGLWPRLERLAEVQESRAELTANLRALDPDDQRDQRRFRDGQHQDALEGYAARERLHLSPTQASAEQAALEAAHRDRTSGKRTLVITQTSNEHLDELNAHAQALRARDARPTGGRSANQFRRQPSRSSRDRRARHRAARGSARDRGRCYPHRRRERSYQRAGSATEPFGEHLLILCRRPTGGRGADRREAKAMPSHLRLAARQACGDELRGQLVGRDVTSGRLSRETICDLVWQGDGESHARKSTTAIG
jgi:AAA domain